MAEKKKRKKKPAARRRRKISAAALIEALQQHILGEREMTSTQVSAALSLLKQAVPREETGAPAAHEDALQELE